jgi:hypothetical protein
MLNFVFVFFLIGIAHLNAVDSLLGGKKKKHCYFVACKLWYLLYSLPGVSWKLPGSAFASLFNWHDRFLWKGNLIWFSGFN